MARITRRASSSCGEGEAYATVSLACVWSADRGGVGPGAAGRRRRADARRTTAPGAQPPPTAAGRSPRRRSRRRRRTCGRRHAESVRAPLEHVPALGPREQRLRRPGALAALPGPSRRPAVHAGTRAARNSRLERRLGADNVGWRDQRYFGNYERVGFLKITGLWDEIPQFYSVDTRTAFTETDDGVLVLDDNAQRAASHNAYLIDLAAIRPARAPRHRHVSRQRHADDAVRRHWRLHDDEAFGRVAVGGELRVQQRQRGGAALPVPHERHGRGAAVDEHAVDVSRRLQRVVVQQPGRHADLGQPAGADGFERTASGSWPDGLVAVQLAADAQRGRLHEVRAADAAHRLAGVRLGEQRRAAAAVHDQQRAAAVRAAARDGRRLGHHGRDDDQPGVAPGGRVAVQHAVPPLRLQQRHARHADRRQSSATTRRSGRARPAGRWLYAHARNTFDADATWTGLRAVALTAAYTNNSNRL